MALDIYFIRHAQSEGNLGLKTPSHRDILLSEQGHRQALELAAAINEPPSIIAVSGFVRTQLTAEPLRQRYPQVPVDILGTHEFDYLYASKWDGTTSLQRKPAVEQYWQRADPYYRDSETSETFADLIDRAESTLHWLSQHQIGPVCLVSHELFIHAVLWRCLAPSTKDAVDQMRAFRQWQQATPIFNASITPVRVENGRYVIPSHFTHDVELPSGFSSIAEP